MATCYGFGQVHNIHIEYPYGLFRDHLQIRSFTKMGYIYMCYILHVHVKWNSLYLMLVKTNTKFIRSVLFFSSIKEMSLHRLTHTIINNLSCIISATKNGKEQMWTRRRLRRKFHTARMEKVDNKKSFQIAHKNNSVFPFLSDHISVQPGTY